jgi:Beta propeller domain
MISMIAHPSVASRSLARASVLGSACLLLSLACSGGAGGEPKADTDTVPTIGDVKLQLARATSCDDLLTRIQDSILVQLSLRAEQLKSGEGAYYGGPGVSPADPVASNDGAKEDPSRPEPGGQAGSGGSSGSSGSSGNLGTSSPASPAPSGIPGDAPPEATPTAPSPPSSGGAAGGGGFSGTTVQVKDVDEADIVKTDGDRIYLLHGGTLFVIAGWPANATAILGSTLIEGTPVEMFVKDGKAVVFSRVYANLDGSGANTGPYPYYYGNSSYTKLSVLDVSGDAPSVLRESFVEGDYNSARRHGDVVRAVVQDGFKVPQLGYPSIEYRDPFGEPYPQADIDAQVDDWLTRMARSIRATDLGDWLPREFSAQNGELVAVAPRCADYYSPDPGLTQSGVTSVVSLDLADVSAPLAGATILGNAERVYSNEDVVLITQTDYRYSYTYDAAATQKTIIHRFDISGNGTAYTASGEVPGSIHDQFSLDERDGIIRVSTTEQSFFGGGVAGSGTVVNVAEPAPPPGVAGSGPAISAGAAPDAPATGGAGGAASSAPSAELPAIEPGIVAPVPDPAPLPPQGPPGSVSRVLTLGTDGDALEVLGETEDFGAGEQIYSTRFIGDRGYVVTFRQTDPLFVIDLADPSDPHVVGELSIPGFSNYLFPLDQNHLFSIGRDATPQGIVQGLALQIFDVTDPASPALAQKYVFPEAGDSPANVDHRAISFHPDRGVVAFPHQSYTTGASTLEVFQLSVEAGFTRLGGMAMTDEPDLDSCLAQYFGYAPGAELDQLRAQVASDPAWQSGILASCRYGHVFRRGLFRDDFVYGISNTGVYVYDFTAMDAGAVAQVSLPAEVYDNIGYGVGGSGPGIATPPLMGNPAPVPDTDPAAAGGSAGAGSAGSAGTGSGGAASAGAGGTSGRGGSAAE